MTKGLRAQTCDLKFGSNTYGVMERKRVIILGASSGIGHEVARLFIKQGWTVGVATRRLDKLADLKNNALERVFTARIDVTDEDAEAALFQLIERMGGLDLYFHSSGIGWKNPTLEAEKEIKTMETNATGFTRMVGAAYRYFAAKGGGHIASHPLQVQRDLALPQLIVQRKLCRTPICKHWNSWQPGNDTTLSSQTSVQALLTPLYSQIAKTFLC